MNRATHLMYEDFDKTFTNTQISELLKLWHVLQPTNDGYIPY